MNKTIGIRLEDKSKWERRVALVPNDIVSFQGSDVTFIAQPSTIRIFPNSEYEKIGVTVQDDIKSADICIGVKEMPISVFREDGMYMFFSHTIKGQKYNIPMLKKLIELKCTLIDYECIVDEYDQRIVFFGKHAGLAGMIDSFHVLGKRLEHEGISTVFSKVKMAYEYGSLVNVKSELSVLAKELAKNGIPEKLRPMVIGFTGYGNVSQGAQEIFDIFPHVEITPDQLDNLSQIDIPNNKLVKVIFKEEHTVEPIEQMAEFDKLHYFANPSKYKSQFSKYIDKITVLMHCIYWSAQSPRILTKSQVEEMYSNSVPKLKVIGDISCDIEGGIECTLKATQPDVPAYVYDVNKKDIVDGIEGRGPVIMAVDNLPCELSKEASEAFSSALKPYIPALIKLDSNTTFEDAELPEAIRKAVILWKGKLTDNFSFMKSFLK